jgi:ribosomal protein S18 acetylase RimI-like enzyme
MAVIAGRHFTIRPITPGDLNAVFDVYRQCEDFLALGPQPRASMSMVEEDLRHSSAEGGVYCGIFNATGMLMGIVDVVPRLFEGRPDVAFLSLLMIAAPYRSRGLGAEVVQLVEAEIARDPDVTVIESGVQVNNPVAIRFWQRMGYVITSKPDPMPDGTTVFHLRKQIRPG